MHLTNYSITKHDEARPAVLRRPFALLRRSLSGLFPLLGSITKHDEVQQAAPTPIPVTVATIGARSPSMASRCRRVLLRVQSVAVLCPVRAGVCALGGRRGRHKAHALVGAQCCADYSLSASPRVLFVPCSAG